MAPLRLRRGQGAMQRNPCYARLFADLPYTPPNPMKASGGQSRAPPVAGGARRKPSEQGSARKAPRADAARPLRTALRPPNPQGFLDSLRGGHPGGRPSQMERLVRFHTRSWKPLFQLLIKIRNMLAVHQAMVGQEGDGQDGILAVGFIFPPGDPGIAVRRHGDGLDQGGIG